MSGKKGTAIVITGPTASGKSALAVDLAQKLQTDIISADSRQIFKGIPIATAVPSEEEKQGIKHHLLEQLELNEYYSASEFENDSLGLITNLIEKNGTAVVCGGSMMYIDALCNGLDSIPTVSQSIRDGLSEEWNRKGDTWLLETLFRLDPDHWEKVDRKNMKRVFHAVEISLQAGKPYSSLLGKERQVRPFNILKIYINPERDKLFERINSRVDDMVRTGLEEEAHNVYPQRGLNSLNTVGLKEMFAWFDGLTDRGTAIERIKKNTRIYAKKQMTWFKRDTNLIPFEMGGNASGVLDLFSSNARKP